MLKKDFVSAIATDCGVTQKDVNRVILSFCKVIVVLIKSGDSIHLPYFGTFSRSMRSAHKCRNIHTAKEDIIPESISIKFKPSAPVKRALNSKDSSLADV